MKAAEIQADMRERLRSIGLSLTEQGEHQARREQTQLRRDLHAGVDKLTPNDLLIVWLIVETLTRED